MEWWNDGADKLLMDKAKIRKEDITLVVGEEDYLTE